MRPADAVVIGLLTVWFLLTLVVQLPFAWSKRVRRVDPTAHLLAGWNFFAPRPIRSDFEVWFRSWPAPYDAFHPSEWRPLRAAGAPRLRHGFAGSTRRADKTVFQACNQVIIAVNAKASRPQILLGIPYLLLLGNVSAHSPRAVAVQFCIDVIRYPNGEPVPATIFVSGVHLVADTSASAAPRPLTVLSAAPLHARTA